MSAWVQILLAGAWLTAAPPAGDVEQQPAPEAQTAAQTAADEDAEPDGTPWGPIVAACMGVLVGGWIARKQIRSWKTS